MCITNIVWFGFNIYTGATSCFVGDNADLIMLKDGLNILLPKVARCIDRLAKKAMLHKSLICLARTHLQPAQPTTMGRRICMWIQDLLLDLENLERLKNHTIRFRGAKGAVGTQASFMDLFQGDHQKVSLLTLVSFYYSMIIRSNKIYCISKGFGYLALDYSGLPPNYSALST